ncbi:SprT-like domain-containing protein [Candidatus Woesearchaeota archaeon]|nr:SprT-like domain-containing protein [Candidatus Woesearchaeota archaeon]
MSNQENQQESVMSDNTNNSVAILRNNDKIGDQESSIIYDDSGEILSVQKRKNLIDQAYEKLFNNKINYATKVKFTAQFNDYNANIRLYNNQIELRLCRKWKQIDKEIVIGLVQSLLLKILKKDYLKNNTTKKHESINIDLYNNFVKNLHIAAPKNKIDNILLESFNKVNDTYFFGQIECPNLVWGSSSIRKLGSYDYKTDTITISEALRNCEKEMLDYIVYHEMLHKKFKFSSKGTKNRFHSREFKDAEKKFKNAEEIERRLKYINDSSFTRKRVSNHFPKKRKLRILDFFSW